jgi:hypothetical protein
VASAWRPAWEPITSRIAGSAKHGMKEYKMRGAKQESSNSLAGFTLYEPPVQLPMVTLNMNGDLMLPPVIADRLGPHVQVFWSADRKALALRACTEIAPGAMAVAPRKATHQAHMKLKQVFQQFQVTIVATSRYGVALTDNVLVIALRDVEVGPPHHD